MVKLAYDGQLCLFDITLSKKLSDEKGFSTYKLLAHRIGELAKKFVFQLEKGDEDGYVHWQIRLSLHKRQTASYVVKKLTPLLPGHWSPTSREVHDSGNQFNYVMKADTRIDGPWSDEDNIPPPPVLTRQLKNYWEYQRYPWQIDAERFATCYDERHIIYICDTLYNSGKSIFCEDLEYRDLACEIPPMTLMEDIMQFIHSQPVSKCYLFDMPAAMKKEKMHQMYSGLEMLKNGFLYDKRYSGKKKRIDRPTIICFANNFPDTSLMAPDRWSIYNMTPDKRLEKGIIYDKQFHTEREYADILSGKSNH